MARYGINRGRYWHDRESGRLNRGFSLRRGRQARYEWDYAPRQGSYNRVSREEMGGSHAGAVDPRQYGMNRYGMEYRRWMQGGYPDEETWGGPYSGHARYDRAHQARGRQGYGAELSGEYRRGRERRGW